MKVIREETARFVLNIFLDHLFDDRSGFRRPDFKIKLQNKHTIERGRTWSFIGMLRKEKVFYCSVSLSNNKELNSIRLTPVETYPWIIDVINYDISSLDYLIFTQAPDEYTSNRDQEAILPKTFTTSPLEVQNLHQLLCKLDEQDKLKRLQNGRKINNK